MSGASETAGRSTLLRPLHSAEEPQSPQDAQAGTAAEPRLSGPSAGLADQLPSGASLRRDAPVRPGAIVALVGPGDIPKMMVNVLADHFGAVTVIEEEKEPTSAMVRRRARLLGPVQAGGHVAFGVLLKWLHRRAASRKEAIVTAAGLSTAAHARAEVHRVPSVNHPAAREALVAAAPQVVVVVGTRMIRKATLDAVDAPFLNYHAGLNPSYRGMNGGYWALANDDPAGAGMTVHLVDEGVDTGAELYWCRFAPTRDDNFVTYPLLQAAGARDLVIGAVRDALDGTLSPTRVALTSKQWFHPTLWGYFVTGLRKGVW